MASNCGLEESGVGDELKQQIFSAASHNTWTSTKQPNLPEKALNPARDESVRISEVFLFRFGLLLGKELIPLVCLEAHPMHATARLQLHLFWALVWAQQF